MLASAACRLAEMNLPGQPQLTVALIGGVATRSEARGRGYASRLLTLCLEWAQNRGAAVAFLWSGRGELYERLGFASSGTQLRVPLDSFLLAQRLEGVEWRSGLTPAIERELIEKRSGGLLLRKRDLIWVRAHRNIDWQGLYRGRELLAYAAIGKGIDLPHCVHEWGGRAEILPGFFAELSVRDPRLQLLLSPAQLDRLGFAGVPACAEPLVYARSLSTIEVRNPEGLVRNLPKDFWFWGLDGC